MIELLAAALGALLPLVIEWLHSRLKKDDDHDAFMQALADNDGPALSAHFERLRTLATETAGYYPGRPGN